MESAACDAVGGGELKCVVLCCVFLWDGGGGRRC